MADVTLSSDDATELMLSLLLLVEVRKDSGLLEGPVTACAAAVATAAARSSECRQACSATMHHCQHPISSLADATLTTGCVPRADDVNNNLVSLIPATANSCHRL